VRNLPPPLSEDAFKEAVGKSFVDRAVWLTYHQGKNGCVALPRALQPALSARCGSSQHGHACADVHVNPFPLEGSHKPQTQINPDLFVSTLHLLGGRRGTGAQWSRGQAETPCLEGKPTHACRTKRKVPSLAYLAFRKNEDVLEFFSHFHDHLFVSERGECPYAPARAGCAKKKGGAPADFGCRVAFAGTQMRAQVEYAPFQQIPKARQRKDPREGTYEKGASHGARLASQPPPRTAFTTDPGLNECM
jgi:hypothetical protein